MLPEVRSRSWRDDGLEHRAEDVGVDLTPFQRTQIQQQSPCGLGEGGHHMLARHLEQPAVDVRKPRQVTRLFLCLLGVERIE